MCLLLGVCGGGGGVVILSVSGFDDLSLSLSRPAGTRELFTLRRSL